MAVSGSFVFPGLAGSLEYSAVFLSHLKPFLGLQFQKGSYTVALCDIIDDDMDLCNLPALHSF